MRALTWALVLMSTTVAAGVSAQPKKKRRRRRIEKAPPPPPLVGLESKGGFAPERGFIDDVVASDADRLGIVVTDGASQVEVQIISTADSGELARLDVAALTCGGAPFYLLGDRVFLVGDTDDDGAPVAAVLVGLDGKVVKAQKPATDHHLMPYKGADACTRTPRSRPAAAPCTRSRSSTCSRPRSSPRSRAACSSARTAATPSSTSSRPTSPTA
jgi:hypothetical protein